MNPEGRFRVVLGDWETSKRDATAIRHEVFVCEQHVPIEIELDTEDAYSVHAVAYDERGVAVGTGRLLQDAHIGRMAVRASHRGLGVGSLLLRALIAEACKRHYSQIVLSAQVHARGFYAAHGFKADGDIYIEAGIEHVTMRRALANQ
jgi:predicted GNAT family N-acyltransferase